MQETMLTSKVALVTGAARRVGAAISRVLHAAEMNIVLHYHASKVEALALCEQLNQVRSGSAVAVSAVLGTADGAAQLIKQAEAAWGRLDVLVNNASQFYRTESGQVTEAVWDHLLASNLKAPFFLAQAAAPLLALHQGCIVNMTDIHAEHPLRDYMVYCISKSGVWMMTKAMAKEWGPLVRVNAVAPGAVAWPEGKSEMSDAVKQKIISRTSLARPGTAADVAKAVLFLVRDAGYITGETIHVDGGRRLFG